MQIVLSRIQAGPAWQNSEARAGRNFTQPRTNHYCLPFPVDAQVQKSENEFWIFIALSDYVLFVGPLVPNFLVKWWWCFRCPFFYDSLTTPRWAWAKVRPWLARKGLREPRQRQRWFLSVPIATIAVAGWFFSRLIYFGSHVYNLDAEYGGHWREEGWESSDPEQKLK